MARASSKTAHGASLVIVESPTKANTIRKYLGDDFIVEASVGHIRDLVTKKTDLAAGDVLRDKSWVHYGVNIDNRFEPLEEIYLVPADKKRQVDALKAALAKCDALYLATDDDREGEAISWHLLQVLKPKVPIKRLVFHEITKEAIAEALNHTRQVDESLVIAQRTRRVVDRLFGWDVSEVLWRKIKPGLSAGRVQSVALRLLTQRERERMAFISSNFWDIDARFAKDAEPFEASLFRLGAQRIASGKDFDDTTGKLLSRDVLLLTEQTATQACERLGNRTAKVLKIEVKPQSMRPHPPFTTSTLQQEANRKLRFSAKQTMQVAQKLYENGFITYMRTDSVQLSDQALTAARTLIETQYGKAYLPTLPRRYQTKTANAQEAHEAIRPAGTSFPPQTDVERTLGRDAERLYDLIWKRTVASQMLDAQVEQTAVDIGVEDAIFRATGRTTRFAGYLKAYVEGSDDPEATLSDRDKVLPIMAVGDLLQWGVPPLDAKGHDTKPPARLTDASLIKALEERGIGRPSTYAAILQNLLDKEYAFRRGASALVPTFMGMAVIAMLEQHMPHLVDYNFTADMEARLDAIARGEEQSGQYLRNFYSEGFPASANQAAVQGLTEVISSVRDSIDPISASSVPIGSNDGQPVVVRIGRYGTFVKNGERTANVPDDLAPDEMTVAKALELMDAKAKGDAPMGQDPKSGEPIFLRNGRFGWYLQRGLASKDDKADKPKMVSLSKGMKPELVTMDLALQQLALPRTVGKDPKSNQAIVVTVGRYGDYLKCGEDTRTLAAGALAITLTLEQALATLAKPKGTQGKEHVRDLGVRARDGKTLSLWTGRYGIYVTDGEVNKTLGDLLDPDTLTVEKADAMLIAALEAKTGKVLGKNPANDQPVRLIDGRFGPYLTDGVTNASLARGADQAEMTLEEALDRIKHFGKPAKGKKIARKSGGAKAKAVAAPKAEKKIAAEKPAAKTAASKKAKAAPKPPPPKAVESGVMSARKAARQQESAPVQVEMEPIKIGKVVNRRRG